MGERYSAQHAPVRGRRVRPSPGRQRQFTTDRSVSCELARCQTYAPSEGHTDSRRLQPPHRLDDRELPALQLLTVMTLQSLKCKQWVVLATGALALTLVLTVWPSGARASARAIERGTA